MSKKVSSNKDKDKKPSETSLSDLIDNASSSVQQRTEKKNKSLNPKLRERK